MNRSLYTKLVAMMMVIILSLMLVVGVFLMRGIRNFYLTGFYDQMSAAFSDEALAADLRSAADTGSTDAMVDILRTYSSQLGISSGTRDYYILSGDTGSYLTGSAEGVTRLEITPNILTALTGEAGYESDVSADYMDVALPVTGESGSYIIYVQDNKSTVKELTGEMFRILAVAMLVAVVVTVVLSLLLARTLVTPIRDLTKAAERVAGGEFSDPIPLQAADEIGVLTRTFNDMAGQLETTLDDLRRSEMMRREFVANVSHELRTPITSIRSYAETLAGAEDIPREMEEEFLRVIINESDRMTNIVRDLLTLSRFDAGSVTFEYERFRFSDSVRDVFNALLLQARSHGHQFTLTQPEDMPQVRGDRARLEQVILNLVSNALKYTPDGGRIQVTTGFGDGRVWCRVQDNGIGIPAESVDRVFDRFYRVDKARSRQSGGTGLGLSIAREIALRHGGDITVESVYGAGSAFTLTLPVEGPDSEA